MTQNEYDTRMNEIEKSYEQDKRQLYVDYAVSQRKFKIGDIITNGSVIIVVEKFGVNKTFGMPQPTYVGKLLKKDLTPRKNGDIDCIYGNHNAELLKSSNL